MRYLGAIASLAPATAAGEAFTERLMTKLASHLEAAERPVRFRAAQALAATLQALPPGACVDEDLAQLLAEGLRDRLRDKGADVRLCAARALGRLPAADEVRSRGAVLGGGLFGGRCSCGCGEVAGAWVKRRRRARCKHS